MDLDFDKEINALLRQAARGGEFVSTSEQNHLDADEISAFAENALPEKTRNVYTKHFAECDRCRKILSNTILLNNEAETETAFSAVTAPIAETPETKIPWYRKMFLMPNLAYTMGALILVFGGMLGFIALQSLYNQTGSSDVSAIQNAPTRSSGPNAGDDGLSYSSNATTSNANAASNSAMTTANSSSNTAASNSTAATANNTSTFPLNEPLIKAPVPAESQNQTATKPSDDVLSAEKNESKDLKEAELNDKNKDAAIAQSDEVAKAAPPAMPLPAPKVVPSQAPPATARRAENAPQAEKKRDRAASGAVSDNRRIGGKTFNRVNGVWIDSDYNTNGSSNIYLPRTKTVRRGSSEYQKLDRQVRIIAESLDGAVIVVWRDGAYRIQ